MTAAATTPCAYCGCETPPERQAAAPWHWPGKGLVTNCYDCAGYEQCDGCGDWFDNAEGWGEVFIGPPVGVSIDVSPPTRLGVFCGPCQDRMPA